MWQVLLGYLWAAELPLEISLGGKHTPHSIKVAEMVRELYECSLSCQGALCSRSLTAGTKWWRVYTRGCQQLKITCWTCGRTLKTDWDNFCGHLVIFGVAAHAHVWTHEHVRCHVIHATCPIMVLSFLYWSTVRFISWPNHDLFTSAHLSVLVLRQQGELHPSLDGNWCMELRIGSIPFNCIRPKVWD